MNAPADETRGLRGSWKRTRIYEMKADFWFLVCTCRPTTAGTIALPLLHFFPFLESNLTSYFYTRQPCLHPKHFLSTFPQSPMHDSAISFPSRARSPSGMIISQRTTTRPSLVHYSARPGKQQRQDLRTPKRQLQWSLDVCKQGRQPRSNV